MRNSEQRPSLIATLAYNGAALAFLIYIALFVGVAFPESGAPWWFFLLLAIVMHVAANLLWGMMFMLLAVKDLFITGVLRRLVRVLIRKSDEPQLESKTPEIGQKLDQALRWSSFPLVAVPIMCLLGVVVFDVVTPWNPLPLYTICLSHCCVGLTGWLFALRGIIGPLPFSLGDGGAMS